MNKAAKNIHMQYVSDTYFGKTYDVLGDSISEVALIDLMGTDYDVLEAARISFNNEASKGEEKDKKLLEYLLKNNHTSPFEQVQFKFYVKAPLVVMNQWQRHRTWHYLSINEVSRRYTDEEIEFYVPKNFRNQSESNKQASEENSVNANSRLYLNHLEDLIADARYYYEEAINDNIAKEQARFFLPAYCLYTKVIVTVDAHNLMHFLRLRTDEHAQWEIRQYAEQMLKLFKIAMPITGEIFEKSL